MGKLKDLLLKLMNFLGRHLKTLAYSSPIGVFIGFTIASNDDAMIASLFFSVITFFFFKLLSAGISVAKRNHLIFSTNTKKKVEARLNFRCMSIRLMNFIILAMIASSTISGIYIFVNAENLARGDSSIRSASERVSETYRDMSRSLNYITQEDRVRKHERDKYRKEVLDFLTLKGTLTAGGVESLEKKLLKKQDTDDSFDKKITKMLKDHSDIVNEMQIKQEPMIKALGDVEKAKTSALVFISTLANKAGSILILYFFIQILVTLYRYNAKSLAIYESKLMLVTLDSSIDKKESEELTKLFDFTALNFDEKEKTPTKELIDLIKSATETMKELKIGKPDEK